MRLSRLLALFVALAFVTVFSVVAAFAQATATAPVVQTPAWLNYVALLAVALTMALFGWGLAIFNKKAGLENNATVKEIEAHARDLLQTALTNLAGRIVMQAGPKLDGMVLDIKNPLIRSAVQSLPKMAGDAMKLFPQLSDPNVVAQKIVDKIGVLTAANPVAVPVQTSAIPSKA
jgi:hypothetical protein